MKRATDIGLFQKKPKQGRRGLSIHFDIHRSFSLVKTNLTFRLLQDLFQQKIHIKVNIFPRLSISLFVLAVMLVMSVSYVCQHLATRTVEHFGKDKKSHKYQHLISSNDCLDKCSKDCFSVLHTANTKHQLRIKESLYITWLKPILNSFKIVQRAFCGGSISF